MATSTQIGDSQAVARMGSVAARPQTVVALTELTDATSFLNAALESGKQAGATITSTGASGKIGVFVAQGNAPTDAWVSQTIIGDDVTPA